MTATPQKVALVTGSAARIGRAIALALARHGWDVAVHFKSSHGNAAQTVALIEALGRRAQAFQCDLGDEIAVQGLLPRVTEAMGTVSCLVNNASLFELDRVDTFSRACLEAHMQVNVTAPVTLTQALYLTTSEQAQAVVVNVLDQKLFNLNPDFLSYTLSKAALQSATVMLAQALAPRVRVAGIAPGITMVSGDQTEQSFAQAHQQTPLGKSSTPDDIAAAVCFITESPAITGTTLLIDGGQHLMPQPRDVMFTTTR